MVNATRQICDNDMIARGEGSPMMSDCSMLRHGWTGAKHRVRRIRRALVLTLLAGCGTLQNTPQQDATYARCQKCLDETHASAQHLRVHPSGDFQWQLTR